MKLGVIDRHFDDRSEVTLSGDIDETAGIELNRLLDKCLSKVTFNFKKVNSINSNGVRTWINFIRNFATSHKVSFAECTSTVVSQMNMVPSFFDNCAIESVYGSYQCHDCGVRCEKLFVSGKNMPFDGADVAAIACADCEGPMYFEEEDVYFSFNPKS